jgi:hypothetical protein
MAAMLGAMFFLSVAAFAAWSIVVTVRPRLARIAFLLQYGPAIGEELPARPRVTSRGRSNPVAAPAFALPRHLRAAA